MKRVDSKSTASINLVQCRPVTYINCVFPGQKTTLHRDMPNLASNHRGIKDLHVGSHPLSANPTVLLDAFPESMTLTCLI